MLTGQALPAFLIAVSFASGLNVYATVATLGLLARFGMVVLPPGLGVIDDTWVIAASASLFAIEFVADKIPVFDLIWNALHTFVRVPAAALMAYAATAQIEPHWQFAAATIGGAIALAAHGGKTAARAAVTPSPEPVSNFLLSTAEDAFTVGVTWFATQHPFIAAVIVLTIVVILVALLHVIIRAFRAMFAVRRTQSR